MSVLEGFHCITNGSVPAVQNSNNFKDDQLKHCAGEGKGHWEEQLNKHIVDLCVYVSGKMCAWKDEKEKRKNEEWKRMKNEKRWKREKKWNKLKKDERDVNKWKDVYVKRCGDAFQWGSPLAVAWSADLSQSGLQQYCCTDQSKCLSSRFVSQAVSELV